MARAYIVAMSHLSDVQEEVFFITGRNSENDNEMRNRISLRANFAKYIISKYSSNMDVDIDPDKDFEDFKIKFPHYFA